jgi:hypothetical protein
MQNGDTRGHLMLKEAEYTELVASLASTKLSEIDECEGEEFEGKVTALLGLKAQQQVLELIPQAKVRSTLKRRL